MRQSREAVLRTSVPQTIILTGAPSPSSLRSSSDSSSQAGSRQEFLPAFRRLFGLDERKHARPQSRTASQLGPKVLSTDLDPLVHKEEAEPQGDAWREIPVPRKRKSPHSTLSPPTLAPQTRQKDAENSRASGHNNELSSQNANRLTTVTDHTWASFSVSFTSTSASSDVGRGHSVNALNDDEAAAAQLLRDETTAGFAARSFSYYGQEEDEDFLEHSFTCYKSAPLSPEPGPASTVPPPSTFLPDNAAARLPALLPEDSLNLYETTRTSFTTFNTSFTSYMSSEGDTSQPPPLSSLPPLPPLSSLTDLEDLPAPQQLLRVQSLNANNPFYKPKPISTIVGVIAISQPTPCRSHKFKDTELIKLIVGDETASGVGVTIWLDSASPILREKLIGEVRRMDVILLRNAVPHTYMGKVYLNSMRNGKTGVDILYRCSESNAGYRPDLGQRGMVVDQQTEKVRRVVEWVVGFVGGGAVGASWEDGDRTVLPEDTQVENSEE
ncbi:hypothetical protein BDZ91DRAFT_730749 [Kalaharituber pfeilii]|nr:hypothetical protein BDZ91DRAFT_730749 [Kalaharituber pfeilii]